MSPKKRCSLIAVDYEPLPFVLDPEEALEPGAVQIWPEGNLSPNAQERDRSRSAPAGATCEDGFASADHVFEDRYSTAFQHNAQMEPRAVGRAVGRATS